MSEFTESILAVLNNQAYGPSAPWELALSHRIKALIIESEPPANPNTFVGVGYSHEIRTEPPSPDQIRLSQLNPTHLFDPDNHDLSPERAKAQLNYTIDQCRDKLGKILAKPSWHPNSTTDP